MSIPEPIVVRGDLTADLTDRFRRAGVVGCDTETSGLDWRRDRLATCQVFAPDVGAVVVQVGDDVPRNLASLLEDGGVEKIFHHAPFDLRFMTHAWGVSPQRVRCTKVASKLLRPDAPNATHSLQALLHSTLGARLRKGPVRTSNWLSDDLTSEQVEYAVGDVVHLPALLDLLTQQLRDAGLVELYDACCAFLPARAALDLRGQHDVFAY